MIPVEEALSIVLGAVEPLPPEKVSLLAAAGRVLAEDVVARRNLPPHDNSAMDGYAIRHADLEAVGGAFRVVEAIPAGRRGERALQPGQASKIMTGAPLPEGADTVVPIEDTRLSDVVVEVLRPPELAENVRPTGEDVRAGDLVIPAGTAVRPAEVGMLASLGRSFVMVHQRPRVAVLATGDEIVDLDALIDADKIVNSNSYGIAAQVQEAGGVPVVLGIGRDDPEALLQMLQRAATADVVVTTGGVSMGDYDHVKAVMAEWGADMRFWKVAIKPGKPAVFGLRGRVPIFGLPGNPVSAMVTFEQFVRPALRRLLGHRRLFRPVVEAILETAPVATKPGRMDFVRCRVEHGPAGFRVVSVKRQSAGILTTLVQANGLIVFPEESLGARTGEVVRVQLYDYEVLEGESPGLRAAGAVP